MLAVHQKASHEMFETNPYFPDFDDVRRRRFEFYSTRQPVCRSRAVVTMVRDEPEFLPIWLEYYSRFFAPEDIYVLDHQTSDGSTSRGGFNRVPVVRPVFSERWFTELRAEFQHGLLRTYDLVVVCDVDEIIAPLPKWGHLGKYLDRFDEDFVNCRGYELLHVPEREVPLDPGRPVLQQRRHWFRNPLYDKPSVATVPMQWGLGFHRRADGLVSYDPDLYLIHLHRMDYDLCLTRRRRRALMARSESDLRAGNGYQNVIVDDEEFARWFHHETGLDSHVVEVEEIDPSWQSVV